MASEKIVACCGSFDGNIHLGHINFLKVAKGFGEFLYVFVAADALIRKYKLREPLYPLEQRMANLKATEIVDKVLANSENEEQNLGQVVLLKPFIYCFGSDQTKYWDAELKKRLEALETIIKVIPRYMPEIYSTSNQVQQCVQRKGIYNDSSTAQAQDNLTET